ncbi:hypothetical protein ACWDRR_38540 [Kitasatospora sp. NPDC003701]
MPRSTPRSGTSCREEPCLRLAARRLRYAALCALAALLAAAGCGSSPGATPTGAPRGAHAPAPGEPSATAPAPPLSAAQLPDAAAQGWTPLPAAAVRPVTGDIRLNECASVVGAVSWQQLAYVGVHRTPALQEVFAFRDAEDARDAYEEVLSGMSECQALSRALQTKDARAEDAEVVRTAAAGRATAWSRRWAGVEGLSAAGPQINHLYAVQHDTTLAVVHFDERAGSGTTAYDTRADLDVLTAITRRLG